MNELKTNNYTLESREVAVMVEKEHKNLLADIRGYIAHMQNSTELKFQPSDFFISSSYKDATGRTLPCFLITRKGCEFIANKLTGQKGTLFTAAYITRFHEMEQAQFTPVTTKKPRPKPEDIVFRQRINMAKDFCRVMGTPLEIAVAKAITDTEKLTGGDYTFLKLLLPARADDKPIPNHNATQLGAIVGLKAQDMNKRLEAAGLQKKIDKKWRLTESGKQHGEEYPFERNGHCDYYIRWRESAVEAVSYE